MTTQFDELNELKRLTTSTPLRGPDPQIVLCLTETVAAEWKFDQIARALWRFFSEDAARNAVQLSISGQLIGYLNRESFFDAAETTKLGEAQPVDLPGFSTNFRFIKLKCPVAGCTAPVVLNAYYDQRNPPMCSIHPEVTLEVA